ncbi:MAG TPA: hypothetical protein DCE44_15430 [Verrucomicrobiales bacterium]|nr:hypothetical protein [Verrucomicrobiales bacterium]
MNPNVRVFGIEVDPYNFASPGSGVDIGTGEGALRGFYVSQHTGRLMVQTEVRLANLIIGDDNVDGRVLPVAGVYASGQSIGSALMALTFGGNNAVLYRASGVVESITVCDRDKQSSALDILFFGALSGDVATTVTDKTAFSLNDSDFPNLLGIVRVAATDYVDVGASTVATKLTVLPVYTGILPYLKVAVVCRGTPTYTARGFSIQCMVRPS